ncbi:MAG TPA: DUF4265 domain-containing protein [Micromonosporaceae bacterium]
MAEPEILHIRLQQDDQWPPFDCEEVRGEPVGGDRYRVLTAPAFARRLAVDDVVSVHRDGTGWLWVDRVVERGEHSTVRVLIRRPEAEGPLSAALAAHGCRVSASPLPDLLVVDVPGPVDYAAVRGLLEDGERQGDWEYQEARISFRHDRLTETS